MDGDHSGGLAARLTVTLGGFTLAVDLRVAPGEVVALLGPNGAGKSTLVRTLAGLTPATAGRVTLAGRTLEDPSAGVRLRPEERGVGVVFQDHLLFPHLSAVENVAFGPRARGVPARRARRDAHDWLTRVGLAELARSRPDQLSGGQAQRVALARALASDPNLLLMDEPLAALDVAARLATRRELRDHLGAFAGPAVVITHDPVEAIALAHRLVIVENGRIVQDGDIDEVTRRPRSAWVAGLVGLNLYRGRADGTTVRLPDGPGLVTGTSARGDVLAAVHPTAVALFRDRPDGTPRNVWSGAVAGLEVHGDRVRVEVAGPLPIVAEVTPAAVAALDLGVGGDVYVAVKATEVDVYPA